MSVRRSHTMGSSHSMSGDLWLEGIEKRVQLIFNPKASEVPYTGDMTQVKNIKKSMRMRRVNISGLSVQAYGVTVMHSP